MGWEVRNNLLYSCDSIISYKGLGKNLIGWMGMKRIVVIRRV